VPSPCNLPKKLSEIDTVEAACICRPPIRLFAPDESQSLD